MSPPAAVSPTEAVQSTFFLDPCMGAASVGSASLYCQKPPFFFLPGVFTSLGRPDVPQVQSQAGLDRAGSLGAHTTAQICPHHTAKVYIQESEALCAWKTSDMTGLCCELCVVVELLVKVPEQILPEPQGSSVCQNFLLGIFIGSLPHT